jgi:orotidine-5'-phosphate decarboxylase
MELFKLNHGIVISCNFNGFQKLEETIKSTSNLPFVAGYKIGIELVLRSGLSKVVNSIRKYTDLPIIYDHQKFGSDVPEIYTKSLFEAIKSSGADALVIIPHAGKETLNISVKRCFEVGLVPIIGGDLVHKGYIIEEGGYIDNNAHQRIYLDAARLGVSHFIMACSRLDRIKTYCHQLGSIVGQLKIFLTGIEDKECSNIPDACEQLKQNKSFAILDLIVTEYRDIGKIALVFWESFQKKLGII